MPDYLFPELEGVPAPPPPKVDPYDGFEEWWKLYPNNKKKKYGKNKCRSLWLREKLWRYKDQIIAAQKDDLIRLNRGEFAPPNDPANRYKYYSNAHAWLNKGKWNYDFEPSKDAVQAVNPKREYKPLTAQQILEATQRGLAKAGMKRSRTGGFYRENNGITPPHQDR